MTDWTPINGTKYIWISMVRSSRSYKQYWDIWPKLVPGNSTRFSGTFNGSKNKCRLHFKNNVLFTVICSKYCSNVCSSTSFPFLPSRWSLRFQIYFILFYWPNREGRYHEACSVNWTEQLGENWIHNLSCRLFLISLDRQRNTHILSRRALTPGSKPSHICCCSQPPTQGFIYYPASDN